VWWVCLSEPLLCRLGFHKWRNYGDEVEVFWQEPDNVRTRTSPRVRYASHHETVYEGRECKRCGIKLRRKFVTNPDGTLSCVGWEPDTEGTDKQ
jgi:hypothetical protein